MDAAHRPHGVPGGWGRQQPGLREIGAAEARGHRAAGGAGAAPRLPGDLEGGGGRPASRRTGRSGGAGKVGAALMEDPRPERGGCVHCSERNRQSQLGNESSGRSPASGCRGRGRAPSAMRGRRPWRHGPWRRRPVNSATACRFGNCGYAWRVRSMFGGVRKNITFGHKHLLTYDFSWVSTPSHLLGSLQAGPA